MNDPFDENTSPELFWISGSPPSWRVMLGLVLKGIPFTSRRLDHGKGENRTPAYLAINPTGQVPALRHGELILRESIAILAWLDRAWPAHPLFGATTDEAAAIWPRVMAFEADLRPAATTIATTLLRNRSAKQRDTLAIAIVRYLDELDDVERRLAERRWLGPDGPSAADCWLYPTLGWIGRALERTRDTAPPALVAHLADRPALRGWRTRFGALPGVTNTHPPHWAEAPEI